MSEWGWKSGLELLVLLCNSIQDLRKRNILLKTTVIYGITGAAAALCGSGGDVFLTILSFLPGLCLLLTAKFSGGKVGYGDGILLLAVGAWTGFLECMLNLTAGLFMAALWCIIRMLSGKMNRKDEIPFVPFLLLGTFIRLIVAVQ